jgi:hypothetical protein
MFANLAALKDAILDEVLRAGDAAFLAAFPRFVKQAENRIYVGGPPVSPLRIREMEQAATITLTDGVGTFPADWLGFKRIMFDTALRSVPVFVHPAEFHLRRSTVSIGAPTTYTIEGSTILTSPKVSGDLAVTYYKRPTALAADGDTNAVLSVYGDIYYQGVLLYASKWMRDPERSAEALAELASAVAGLNTESIDTQHSGNHLAPSLRRVV